MKVLPAVLVCVMVIGIARDAAPASAIAPLTRAQVRAVMSDPTRHVRAVDRTMSSILAEGMRRSGTFAHLVLALDKSDVFVYIETGRLMPAPIAGRLLLAAGPEGHRYLRIQVSVSGYPGSNDIIALVGHELRHALEVAECPEVRDEASLIALYERIGHSSTGAHHYDTLAAQDTGRKVKAELIG
jgi:hypothetical protein